MRGLREAVRRLIRGEVDDHNGKFIPSTAILSRVVRYEDDRLRIQAAYAGRKRLERQPENVVVLDAATRAKRVQQLKELAVKLQGMQS